MLRELLLPRTDAGVLAQALVAFPVLLGVLVVVRRDREVRLFVLGVLVMTVAFFGLRSLH